jgi:hypothetical protein
MTSKRPPIGVRVTEDIEVRDGPRGVRFMARIRWSDPETRRRRQGARKSFETEGAARAWIDEMADVARTGVDPG